MTGVIDDARGLGLHDHVCWAYESLDDFHSRAREFLADGLEQGQRVWYVALGDVAGLVEDVCAVKGMDRALRTGAAQVVSLEGAYSLDAVMEPTAQVDTFVKAARQAVAAGFTGLRVAADVTALVRTPAQLDAFARYEYLIDRTIASEPLCGMCALDRAELGDQVINQLVCLHPSVNQPRTQFRLHAAPSAAAVLAGEVDLTSEQLFRLTVQRAEFGHAGSEIVIDATDLTYIGHRSLLTLAEHARRAHSTVVLRHAWPGAARLTHLLDLDTVRVEPRS
jgi:anti-anti-sigma regulatory factor